MTHTDRKTLNISAKTKNTCKTHVSIFQTHKDTGDYGSTHAVRTLYRCSAKDKSCIWAHLPFQHCSYVLRDAPSQTIMHYVDTYRNAAVTCFHFPLCVLRILPVSPTEYFMATRCENTNYGTSVLQAIPLLLGLPTCPCWCVCGTGCLKTGGENTKRQHSCAHRNSLIN